MRPTFAYAPGPFDQPPEHPEICGPCLGHVVNNQCRCEPEPDCCDMCNGAGEALTKHRTGYLCERCLEVAEEREARP